MTTKASPQPQDLPPIAWRNPFLDGVEVKEIPGDLGQLEWALAVKEWQQEEVA